MTKFLANALVGACLLTATTAAAGIFSPVVGQHSDPDFRYLPKNQSTLVPKAMEGNIATPDYTLTSDYYQDQETMGTIFSPTGKEWFYVLEIEGTRLNPENPYYKDMDFTAFTIKVYDERLNFVGQAHGDVIAPEGSLKCRRISPSVQLTSTFFNVVPGDIEVMFALAFNPGPDESGAMRYGAKQTTQAYSLTTDIPEGGSKLLFHTEGYCISAVNTGNAVSENYTMLFANDTSWDGEDTRHCDFTIFKKAEWGKDASLVKKLNIDLYMTMADGINETIPVLLSANGSDVYVATAMYEKMFLQDPTAADPTLNKDNNYIITLYKLNGNDLAKVSETKIPCSAPDGEYIYRSYALGNFSAHNDLTFDFGDGETPCYIITVVDSDNTDDTSANYYVYDVDGNVVASFGGGSSGYVFFSDFEGQPKQYGFNMLAETGEYGYVIVDYPSLQEVGVIPTMFEYDGDLWNVISVPDRAMIGGKPYYVCSALPTGSNGDGGDHFIAWFGADGQLDHLDSLHMGESVAKVLSYITGPMLNPYVLHTDSNVEYFTWVYRFKEEGSSATSLELAVCDTNGNIIAARKMPDSNTYPNAYVSNTTTDPFIVISYRENNGTLEGKNYTEFIKLPLNNFEGEGTAESPYILKTFGDLDQVRNNLLSHFRMANSIDCSEYKFRPIDGEFLGSFDGAGYEIANLDLVTTTTGQGFFTTVGHQQGSEEEVPAKAVVKNVTFTSPSITYNGNLFGTKQISFVAGRAVNATFENVVVADALYNETQTTTSFGSLASSAVATDFIGCGAINTDIALSRSSALGGLVGDARNSTIKASAFSGSLNGVSNVGGIVGNLSLGFNEIADCHVDAAISGTTNVGAVVGSSNRSYVHNNLVEGSVEALANVGGIIGSLSPADVEEDPAYIAAEKNVVALNAFSDTAAYAHRIIGFSRIDLGDTQEWVPDNPADPEGPGKYVTLPASHETAIGENVVISDLAPVGDETLATEGTTVYDALSDAEFFQNLGFKVSTFASMANNGTPWVKNDNGMIYLYFEDAAKASFRLAVTEVNGVEGAEVKVDMTYANIDPSELTFGFSDPSVAELAAFEAGETEGTAVLTFKLLKKGHTIFTLSSGTKKAAVNINVTQATGIENVTVASAISFDGSVVKAAGCALSLFDAAGRIVAQGDGEIAVEAVSAGIYVARAVAADGTASTLKISIR